MRIHRVAIQGYRSLYEVEIAPRPLTVLTGPNNSGKTNLMEAIEFLSDAERHSLEFAISRKGGMANIAFRRMRRTRRPITFKVQATIPLVEVQQLRYRLTGVPVARSKLQFAILHSFSFSTVGEAIEAEFVVRDEYLSLLALGLDRPARLVTVTRDEGTIRARVGPAVKNNEWMSDAVYPFNDAEFRRFLRETIEPTDLLTGAVNFNPVIRQFAESLGRTRLYQLVPLELRRSGVPTPNADVDRHGENLPAWISYVRQRQPRVWLRVLDAMQKVVPDLTDVDTRFTSDRRLALDFLESGVRQPWTAEDISDGTIQSLALFTAVLDERNPLVAIEEPENSVHPWVLRQFVDVCRSVRRKQVIVSTHSPALLNYLDPEDVVLVWRRGGRTHVQPLLSVDPSAREMWAKGRASVFELLDSGVLPESVPGEAG